MTEIIKSSFIPKKEIKEKKIASRGVRINIFFIISLIIFLSTIIGAVGMYFWKTSLEETIKMNTENFRKAEEKLEIEKFKVFLKFDKRINVAKDLLSKHYYITPIFKFLERYTLPDIYYTDMDLKESDDYIELNFSGVANQFSDIVLQKDIYTKNPNIEDFMFMNINTSKETGKKIFDMTFKVNKKWLSKEKLLADSN